MKHRLIMRTCAIMLCAAMLFPAAAWAAQTEGEPYAGMPEEAGLQLEEIEESTAEAADTEQEETEESASAETDLQQEETDLQQEVQALPVDEEMQEKPQGEAMTEDELPAFVVTETEEISETEPEESEQTEEADTHVITGFEECFGPLATAQFPYRRKPSLQEAKDALPKTLYVYLDGEQSLTAIPVSWECVGDYENTAFFYYQFDPKWDSEVYELAAGQQPPYAAVSFGFGGTASTMSRATGESAEENELQIFHYLTGRMGLSAAAACGIMANIYCESAFYADIEESTSSANKGYGLCQWTAGRRTNLENYCAKNNLNYKTVDGQMQFLEYELTTSFPSLLAKLQGTANTSQGAYQAGYDWCYNFERPYNYASVSVTRGNLSRDSFWPEYSSMPITPYEGSAGTYLRILDASAPASMNVGSSFPIRGSISSSSAITTVTVGVYDGKNTMKIGKTVKPNVKVYSLVNVDEDIVFSKLTAGTYRYRVTAANSEGSKTLVNKVFHVLASGRTVGDGEYEMISSIDSSYLAVINRSTGNLELGARADGGNTRFQVKYHSAGYYTIKNTATGKYIYVEGQSAATSAKVYGSSSYTLWQILPTGKGSYCLVPKCASGSALDVTGGKAAAGQNVKNYTANLGNAQSWILQKASSGAPVITGATAPGTLTAGSSFGISGILSCSEEMQTVTAGVYDAGGKMKIGKSASPGSLSYDLGNLDAAIVFGNLTAGVYRYRVTVVTSRGTYYPVNKTFAVLSKGKTLADGTYQMLSAKDNQFAAGVSGNSSAEGANVVLDTKKNSNFQNYTLTYQSAGYYKIKNAGSGKYLTVAAQSSAAKANVTLTAAGTLWQVLPDGYGNHYLVPKCSTGSNLDLSGGKLAAGQNIQIYTHNLAAAQRWKMAAAANAAVTFSISGQSLPTVLQRGEGFGIEGLVKSNHNLTSVTVGVYDSSGKKIIGKTVSPNALSYNLSGVDYDIRFGQLAAGGYSYKVTASAAAATKTLVSRQFVVLADAATVSNGTYRIVSVKGSGYDMIVKGSSKQAGAALTLITASGKTSEKFRFTYQSSGNYKIQNVNSGLFLMCENQGKTDRTKIIQSSSASLWQILPDGNSAYYIVPSHAADKVAELSSGKVADNQPIWLYTNKGGPAQRWKLQ